MHVTGRVLLLDRQTKQDAQLFFSWRDAGFFSSIEVRLQCLRSMWKIVIQVVSLD